MDTLGIRNVTQLKTWMKWYRNSETHHFHQPVGKPYTFGKGPTDLSKIEQKDIEIRQLRTKILVLEKFVEVSRRWGLK